VRDDVTWCCVAEGEDVLVATFEFLVCDWLSWKIMDIGGVRL